MQTKLSSLESDDETVGASLTVGRIYERAFTQVDGASCVAFRFFFGALMAYWAWDYLVSGRLTELYVRPAFHFTYFGFDWVRPWPGDGMYFHFLVMVVASLCVCLGLFYRLASVLLAVAFTYFFLLDRTNYQNHYYLLALFCWWMPLLPLNRMASLDVLRRPAIKRDTVPTWVLWCLLLHVAIPYFYGGLAKLTTDWLLGQPMSIMLGQLGDFPVLGDVLVWPPMGVLLSILGLLFDVFAVPALLYRRTRLGALIAATIFHLSNSVLFQIHVFPWFMIAATTLFMDPSWPRLFLSGSQRRESNSQVSVASFNAMSMKGWLFCAATLCYVSFHALWPLRHNLYQGETSWTERGHVFAWRMMLRGKEVAIGYALRDPKNGAVVNVDHRQFLAAEQAEKFPRDPEMILHMAHFLADEFEAKTKRRPEIYALVLASLNGRKPQMMVDPNTNLAAEQRGIYFDREWVPPLEEPLRKDPWQVPVEQWKQQIEMPKIDFLASADG